MVASEEESTSPRVQVRAPPNDKAHVAHAIRCATISINGTPTDFIVQPFSDRIFVIVTQFQKLGTMVHAQVDVSPSGAESYAVNVIIGKRDVPEIEMCARTIMSTMTKQGCTKPLLLSLALSDHHFGTMRAVIEQVHELRVW